MVNTPLPFSRLADSDNGGVFTALVVVVTADGHQHAGTVQVNADASIIRVLSTHTYVTACLCARAVANSWSAAGFVVHDTVLERYTEKKKL
jgi:hypothetical protein